VPARPFEHSTFAFELERIETVEVASRNQRLREALSGGMSLFVRATFSEADPQRIEYMHVSASLPTYVQGRVARRLSEYLRLDEY
jgi:hypothetical protein